MPLGTFTTKPSARFRAAACSSGRRQQVVVTCSSANPTITVVGGGVIGLTSALRLKQSYPESSITVVAEKFSRETTSEGAGGLWKPFALTGTPDELVNRWGKETLDHYMDIYLSDQAKEAGVLLTSAYELFEEETEEPAWKTVVPGFRRLTPEEILFYDPSGRHVYGYAYETIVTEARLYMDWIIGHLKNMGVMFVQKKLESVEDIPDSTLLVNCSGLGARELFHDDTMYGIRGHVLRVRAPWVRHHVESHGLDASRPAYIIPNTDTVVLGGTKEAGNEDTTSTEEERKEIFDRCKSIVPSLESAEIVASWVGLRPGRPGIRLESELTIGNKMIIHNYGHGGSGITLAWGCAGDVVSLARPCLNR